MSEIDPVIFDFQARVNGYLADVRRTTDLVDRNVGRQEQRIKSLEREMARSSGAISGHLKGLAGTLAGYFTGRELVGLLDNFTRLQNQLKVSGLEGERLKGVQDKLFESAQKYGVSINALAELYSKASQAGQELGATDAQLLGLTDATAQALLITGTSSEQAAGAILGLSQALASGTVRAEEFNQINEGGLRPLLQAAAASERFGGSVAKLRAAVLDGKVSSQEFYQAILQNAQLLEGQASKATLTLSAGFTTLTNALTVYFGEADKANGVSAALGEALGALADNLDTLIPAIALIASAIGIRYVVSATAAAGATILASDAIFALQARMAGAATTAEALSFAMGGMKFGLVSAAIIAVGAALYYVGTQATDAADKIKDLNAGTADLEDKSDALEDRLRKAGVATDDLGSAAQSSASDMDAFSRSMEQAAKRAKALEDQVGITRLKMLQMQIEEVQADRARLKGPFGGNLRAFGQTTPEGVDIIRGINKQEEDALNAREAALRRSLVLTSAAMRAGVPLDEPAKSSVTPSANTSKAKARKGRSGPGAADVEKRFNDELAGYAQQALSAQAAMASSAEQRADYELRGVELARLRTIDDIEANKDYSKAQKKRLLAQVEVLTELERERVIFEQRRAKEQEAQQLADEEFNAKRDALAVQFDLADTQDERKRLSLEILKVEQEHLRATLDAVVASKTASDADKQRAQVAIDALNALSAGQQQRVSRQNETDVERYMRGLNKSPQQINEAIDGIKIDGLDALNDGLVDAVMGVKSLGDVFSNVAKQIIADLLRIAVQKTIVNSLGSLLFGGSNTIGGNVGALNKNFDSILGTVPKHASGTNFAPGGISLVGERGPELVNMPRGAQVIPNHLIGATLARGGQVGGTIRIELSDDLNSRVASISGPIAVQVVRNSAPGIIAAGSQLGSAQARNSEMSRRRRTIPSW